jgi:hypothetical protein
MHISTTTTDAVTAASARDDVVSFDLSNDMITTAMMKEEAIAA